MPHLVLLGDSIFDNGFYVPREPAVIEQVRAALGKAWIATLVAVDGNVTIDVARQLERLPADATHLAISVGGNDALRHSAILGQPARGVGEALRSMNGIQTEFHREYRAMLEAVLAWRPPMRSPPTESLRHGGRSLPTVVCTIYDAIPDLPREALAALSFFNDVITREAARAGVPVLDLRVLCRDKSDYSSLSPIEPSAIGGAKIAEAMARFFTTHDFSRRECVVFC
jgi:hypothetical protein